MWGRLCAFVHDTTYSFIEIPKAFGGCAPTPTLEMLLSWRFFQPTLMTQDTPRLHPVVASGLLRDLGQTAQKKNEAGDATRHGSHWAQPRHGFADGAAEKRHQLVVVPLPGRVESAQAKKNFSYRKGTARVQVQSF